MQFVLISACLLGDVVRYDGSNKKCHHWLIQRWLSEGRIVSMCPEVMAGLPVPRSPAEISDSAGGARVLEGSARVIGPNSEEFSIQFVTGAQRALKLAQTQGIQVAILKEGSPSCGTSFTYDGTFSSTKVEKPGVTASILQQAGIHIFSENQLESANRLIMQLETRPLA